MGKIKLRGRDFVYKNCLAALYARVHCQELQVFNQTAFI